MPRVVAAATATNGSTAISVATMATSSTAELANTSTGVITPNTTVLIL